MSTTKVKTTVCSDCIKSFKHKEVRVVKVNGVIPYTTPVCEKCFIENEHELAYSDDKPVTDTRNYKKGTPTPKGVDRFYFENDKGKQILSTLENAFKNNYKPITK